MILPPFNYADKVSKGVEIFFSVQRQTLKTAFENLERLRIFWYKSFGRTQIYLQNATDPFGQQILTTQLAVRRSVNQAFQSKLPKAKRQWETLQYNFSNYCDHALNQTNYSVVVSKRATEQSQNVESRAKQLTQNILNSQLDIIQDNMIKGWARPTVLVTVQENKEEEVLTEVKASVTKTAIPEVVSFLDPVLTNNESKPLKKQSTEQASEFVLSQSTLEEKSTMTKVASNPKGAQRTCSSRNSRRSK